MCEHFAQFDIKAFKSLLKVKPALQQECPDCVQAEKVKETSVPALGEKQQSIEERFGILYICLHCLNVGCARGIAGHAEAHHVKDKSHTFVCRFNGVLHCYSCDKDFDKVDARHEPRLKELVELLANYMQRESRAAEEKKLHAAEEEKRISPS